jgi:hypothetical protein
VSFGRQMSEDYGLKVDKYGGERGVYGLVLRFQGLRRGDTEKPGNGYEELPF